MADVDFWEAAIMEKESNKQKYVFCQLTSTKHDTPQDISTVTTVRCYLRVTLTVKTVYWCVASDVYRDHPELSVQFEKMIATFLIMQRMQRMTKSTVHN